MTDNKLWPESLQKPLMRAAFLSGAGGVESWELWKSQVNMEDHPDLSSFRLLPQLYHNLQSLGINDFLVTKLKGIARQIWYKNQRFFRSVSPIVRSLNESGINCMMLTGPAIALRYASDYALGSDTTLALLVSNQQVMQTIKHLQSLGWSSERNLPEEGTLEQYLAAGWAIFFRDATGRRIHLQWHLLPGNHDADTNFWDGSLIAEVQGTPVRVLNPADQILYSCVEQISPSGPSIFLRAIDVMLIVKAVPDLDWNRFLIHAEKYHFVIPILEVLQYIQANLDEPLPSAVWQHLRSLPISWQDRIAYRLKISRPLFWGRFWQLWFEYRSSNSSISLLRSIIEFPLHLQRLWRLPALRQVPSRAISIFREYMQN